MVCIIELYPTVSKNKITNNNKLSFNVKLETLQKIVGGSIEGVMLSPNKIEAYVNEEGVIQQLPQNELAIYYLILLKKMTGISYESSFGFLYGPMVVLINGKQKKIIEMTKKLFDDVKNDKFNGPSSFAKKNAEFFPKTPTGKSEEEYSEEDSEEDGDDVEDVDEEKQIAEIDDVVNQFVNDNNETEQKNKRIKL